MLLNKKNSGRDRKCCDIGGIGLAKLIIKREKSMMGAALAAAGNHTRGDARNRGKLPDGISVLRRKKENAAGIPV